jgi:MFS family permease
MTTQPDQTTNKQRLDFTWQHGCAGLLALLTIVITAFASQFSRMIGDDYLYPARVAREGVWATVAYWYNNWSGNYSAYVVQSVLTLFDPSVLGWLLGLTLLGWWGGSWWLFYEIARRIGWQRPRLTSLLFGSILTATVIDGLFNIYDTLYWASGSIAHVLPLVGLVYFAAFVSWFARRQPSKGATVLAVGLTIPYLFFVAGFSSPSTAHLIVALFLLIVALWRLGSKPEQRAAFPVLIAALLTALGALVIIMIAPGTVIRQTYFPSSPGVLEIVKLTVLYTLEFLAAETAVLAPASILLTLLIAGWAGYRLHPGSVFGLWRYRYRLMGAISLAGLALIASAFSTGAYAMSSYLPARANTTPAFTLILAISACGYIMGASLRRRLRPNAHWQNRLYGGAVVVFMILGPGLALVNSVDQAAKMAAFNHDWYTIHGQLRAAQARGEQDVVVSRFSFDLAYVAVNIPLTENPNDQTNRDLASYYGFRSVIAPP